jgi:glycosyltransferase involved in cell wall biosynthesis
MKDCDPLITVYITNYNYELFIKQSIESVVKQTFQNFELLIIDDGSTDKSKEIIEKYRERENITIIYQKNKGLNITNNVAMRVAKGKYLMRLDADDFLEPIALEKMVDILEKDKELGLVFPDYFYVDASGNKIGKKKRHDFDKEVSLYDQPAHGACTLIRLEFLKKLGGYNESFTCQDGYDLWIKFVTHYKVTNINQPLFSYRMHGNNLTANEDRILSTRQKIKDAFVRQHYTTPNTLAIIPIRNFNINGINWTTHQFNGSTIIIEKIKVCLNAKRIQHVVVTSSDQDILTYCSEEFNKDSRVSILERPKIFEGPNQSLANTIDFCINFFQKEKINFESILTVALEYPFLKPETIDEAIDTLVLFKADSVITVRPDNSTFYKHVGSGMIPILDQEKFTRLERDALYKGAGGIMLTQINQFNKTKLSASGQVAHVVVDKRSAFEVKNEFDLKVFESLMNF